MVTTDAAPRRRSLPGRLLLALGCWACFVGPALPGVAAADPYVPTWAGASEPVIPAEASCPVGPGPITEEEEAALEPQARSERLARVESAQACARDQELDVELAHRLWWIVAQLAELNESSVSIDTKLAAGGRTDERLGAIEKALTVAGGVPVSVASYPKPLEVESAPGGLELDGENVNVSDTAVLAAVREGTETSNQNVWGIAGLAAGVLALCLFVWKMVRP